MNHEVRHLQLAHGTLAWREAGTGTPLVLLHGIGSGSGSWSAQLEALAATHRVLAWDAPGYGESAPLANPRPLGTDYAQVLAAWLAALQIGELALVGHSLGAIVAAAWAARPTAQLHALVLASPARGYASAAPDVRAAKWRERIELVERLGAAGMAEQRAAGLCAPDAPAAVVEQVRRNMARVTPGGYIQAAHLLAHDDLLAHAHHNQARATVLCGELDKVTPPAACRALAHEIGAPYRELAGVAHACYVEDPAQFNAALQGALDARH